MTALPVFLESVVALLLVITLGYCFVLERRMRAFRSNQEALRTLICDLDSATGRAERAVAGLSLTTKEAQSGLESKINDARNLTRSLSMLARTTSKHSATRARAMSKSSNGVAV